MKKLRTLLQFLAIALVSYTATPAQAADIENRSACTQGDALSRGRCLRKHHVEFVARSFDGMAPEQVWPRLIGASVATRSSATEDPNTPLIHGILQAVFVNGVAVAGASLPNLPRDHPAGVTFVIKTANGDILQQQFLHSRD